MEQQDHCLPIGAVVFVVFRGRGLSATLNMHYLMSDVNPFADKLKQLRGENSLYQVAQQLGIDRGQLKRYEDGRIPESEAVIVKLAKHYGIPIQELQNVYFETIYPVGSFFREAVFQWVKHKQRNP